MRGPSAPSAVAIHRVVAAAHRRDPLGGQLGEIRRRGVRRDVAAVGERVDPGPFGHPLGSRQLEQRAQVIDVGVHAAVRDEAEQMDVCPRARAPARNAETSAALRANEPSAIAFVHAHEILVEDPAGADREVTDLGVAHLPGREPHGLAGRCERRMRVALAERVEDRRVGELDGVARPRRREPPAVEDDEDDGPQATSAPARQIASNDGDVERGAADERAVHVRQREERRGVVRASPSRRRAPARRGAT